MKEAKHNCTYLEFRHIWEGDKSFEKYFIFCKNLNKNLKNCVPIDSTMLNKVFYCNNCLEKLARRSPPQDDPLPKQSFTIDWDLVPED